MITLAAHVWGVHAARVLVGAARAGELPSQSDLTSRAESRRKDSFGGPPKPTREPRALPR